MIGDYRDIILAPVITEKSAMIAEAGNKIVFKVKPSANKVQIKQAIEKIYNVKVTNVNTINVKPKTKRVGCLREKVYITEKIDGSNMVIFKKDDLLYVAQRKTIICEDEFETVKDVMYKGLYQWLSDYKE